MTLSDRIRAANRPTDDIRVWTVRSLDEMSLIYAIRQVVFVEEQGLTTMVQDDPDDRYSYHVLAAIDDRVIGAGRVTFAGDEGQIAWVAVLKSYRGRGVGRAVMNLLLDLCREQSCTVVSLNAQTHALQFYETLGFRAVGRRFYMSNIEHQHMVLEWSHPQPQD